MRASPPPRSHAARTAVRSVKNALAATAAANAAANAATATEPATTAKPAPARTPVYSTRSFDFFDVTPRARQSADTEATNPPADPSNPPFSPAARPSAWARAEASLRQPGGAMQELVSSSRERLRAEAAERAAREYREAMANAHSAWGKHDLTTCDEQLRVAALHMPGSDVLHRFRRMVHTRRGDLDDAISEAGHAVAANPASPRNHHALAVSCQAKRMLLEAGPPFLAGMGRGLPGTSLEVGFCGYLDTVQRQRHYFGGADSMRPSHRKHVGGGGSNSLARAPARGSIFDPHKVFDDRKVDETMPTPAPPMLWLRGAAEHSLTLFWRYGEGAKEGERPKGEEGEGEAEKKHDLRPATADGSGVAVLRYEMQVPLQPPSSYRRPPSSCCVDLTSYCYLYSALCLCTDPGAGCAAGHEPQRRVGRHSLL